MCSVCVYTYVYAMFMSVHMCVLVCECRCAGVPGSVFHFPPCLGQSLWLVCLTVGGLRLQLQASRLGFYVWPADLSLGLLTCMARTLLAETFSLTCARLLLLLCASCTGSSSRVSFRSSWALTAARCAISVS